MASVKGDLWGLFKNFIQGIPHYVFQYTHLPAGRFIKKTIQQFQPDIIHIDHLNTAQYLPKIKKEKWILEHHNVETYLYWTRFVHTIKPTRKLYLLIEMVLTYFYERKMLPKFDFIFAISEPEKKRLQKIFGVEHVAAQPLIYQAKPIKKRRSKNPYILFIGMLGWPPNEDAVRWFIKKILPTIEKQIPNVEFHIVGRSYPPFEKTLPIKKNVILHGYQTDLTPFLAQADVFVLPFKMGGGVRLKALTSLAAGLPIVSTSLGVEGLKLIKNKHYLEANSTKQFIEAIIRILSSPQKAQKMVNDNNQYIKKNHNTDQNDKFMKKYDSVLKKNHQIY